jgi:asparagine synthase (glutamine-hydrolysing)
MCGIAGHVGERPLAGPRVDRTLELMGHRGPDNRAHRAWVTPDGRHVDLLHSRLNIIDLDPRSDQPFQLGSKWIAYNGELYNYVELKRELSRQGASFRTSSDTEVMVSWLERGGWDALEACEGMWAFAVYDESDGTLGLSRDRFGEKPLYLYRDTTGLYFGSEVKLIAAMLGRRLEVNHHHLHRYLVNGYKALYKGDETFFRGVSELTPGTTILIGADGRERIESYWDRVPRPQREEMTRDEAVEGSRERLIRSVELRLRADVPLAFCMSGGIDSVSLISIAKRVFDYDVHGFTIVNSDERYEEQDMVDAAVTELGLRHTSIPVETTGFLTGLRGLVRHHDAPVYTITYYAHWLLMQSIAEHGYRISVSGSAADELFSGYYDHHLAYLHEVRREPALATASRDAWIEHVQPAVRNPFLQNPDYFSEDPSRREHIYLDAEQFAGYLNVDFEERFTEEPLTDDLLRNRMLNELFHEAVPVILHEDDLNAMYFSIENRSPFLDRELFEFSTTIPTRHLIRDAFAKSVLRDAMRGIVPDPILDNRRKVGFNAPILDYLDTADPGVREFLLDESPIFDHVRRERIAELLDADWLPNSQSKFLFYFTSAKMFLEEFER